MANLQSLLEQRLKGSKNPQKMQKLAEQSRDGERSSFSGVFSVIPLSKDEEGWLTELLDRYKEEGTHTADDVRLLSHLTAEVKAIQAQSALLHGERISRAQEILIRYQPGAFSIWLEKAYGNRQTPYNFLQYFLFYQAVREELKPILEKMPRQAIYTLASRQGDLKVKEELVQKFKGETKDELLEKIRIQFPLSRDDKRGVNKAYQIQKALEKALELLKEPLKLTKTQRDVIFLLIKQISHHKDNV